MKMETLVILTPPPPCLLQYKFETTSLCLRSDSFIQYRETYLHQATILNYFLCAVNLYHRISLSTQIEGRTKQNNIVLIVKSYLLKKKKSMEL